MPLIELPKELPLKEHVKMCHEQLLQLPYMVDYLKTARGFSDDIIKHYQLGYGIYYGQNWIVIPIKDIDGEVIVLKLRKDPFDFSPNSKLPKYIHYPHGATATIFDWSTLLEQVKIGGDILVAEGEMDSLCMISHGTPSITATTGSQGFKDEFIDTLRGLKNVWVCFDNDQAGKTSQERLVRKIADSGLTDIKGEPTNVFSIKLPEIVGEHGDITDYFVKHKGNVDELFFECSTPVFPTTKEVASPAGSSFIPRDEVERAAKADCTKFVEIKRRGNGRSFALCPFHNEKTPSFCCFDGGKGFHCFSCNTGGNAIDLVMKLYKLEFKEAVRYVLGNS